MGILQHDNVSQDQFRVLCRSKIKSEGITAFQVKEISSLIEGNRPYIFILLGASVSIYMCSSLNLT